MNSLFFRLLRLLRFVEYENNFQRIFKIIITHHKLQQKYLCSLVNNVTEFNKSTMFFSVVSLVITNNTVGMYSLLKFFNALK